MLNKQTMLNSLKKYQQLCWYFFVFVWGLACTPPSDTLFDALPASKTGIAFKNILRETEDFNVLNYGYFYNGGGVAIGDLNNDGLPDIYFTGNLVASRLYLNQGDMEFKETAQSSGVDAAGLWNTGVTLADVNGDGWLDIYVCRSAAAHPMRRENLFFLNQGTKEPGGIPTFLEMGALMGINDQGYSTQAAFWDYDRDGDLDLYVMNHSVQEYAGFGQVLRQKKQQQNAFYGDRLYRNELNPAPDLPPGGFTDVTKEAGILTNVLGFGLGLAIEDFNQDHWPDLYISNDYNEQDYLYINQQDGTFQEQLNRYVDHTSLFSMGSDVGDVNNDGLPDLLTLDMLPADNYRLKMTSGPDNYVKYQRLVEEGFYHQTMRNMLQVHNGQTFVEMGQLSGISNTDWSWAALFADFDLDGWQDLFITNGYESDYTNMDFLAYATDQKQQSDKTGKNVEIAALLAEIPGIQVPNYLYQNQRNLTFQDKSQAWGIDESLLSSGAAYGDLDLDGDLDLVVNNVNETASIYRNQTERLHPQHYLSVRLQGKSYNTQGVGAKVCVYTGEKMQCRTQIPTRGFQSAVEPILHFGLGSDSLIERLTVLWPDGTEQVLTDVAANQNLILKQGNSLPEGTPDAPVKSLFSALPAIAEMVHQENPYLDFKREPLLPQFLSTQGPKMAVGDLNGDGNPDLILGGAKGQSTQCFRGDAQGEFVSWPQPTLQKDARFEDIGLVLFDADGDKDLDLYVVSGGHEGVAGEMLSQDRLYFNDGNGNLQAKANHLPVLMANGSCVIGMDFDEDGDQDLFVGGRSVPGQYPQAPRSFLLENDGTGHFTDVTETKAPALLEYGMITDGVFLPRTSVQQPTLMLVGEWVPISAFVWENGQFQRQANTLVGTEGWWNCIKAGDFDGDGDQDMIVGNLGLNSQIKASSNEPMQIYVKDFDQNGQIDPVITYYLGGKSYPMLSRDDLIQQLPALKRKYVHYRDYADQTIGDIFSPDELKDADILTVNTLQSVYLENAGQGNWTIHPLPLAAQVAPVYAIGIADVDEDGKLDAILTGNLYGTRVKFGRYDANHGVVLKGDGRGGFKVVNARKSGLSIRAEIRDLQWLFPKQGPPQLLFGQNNGPVLRYQWNKGGLLP